MQTQLNQFQIIGCGLLLLTAGALQAQAVEGGSAVEASGAVEYESMMMAPVSESPVMNLASEPTISDLYRFNNLRGLAVQNNRAHSLGKIGDILIDSEGQVRHILVRSGGILGIGGEHYLVPWQRMQIDDEQQIAFIDMPQDRLSAEFAALESVPQTRLQERAGWLERRQPTPLPTDNE